MYIPLRIDDSLVLDPRKAVWLPSDRTLAVADLHLGYAWVHRAAGNLLPVARSDDTAPRIATLLSEYQPEQLVLLGDIVHRAAPLPALLESLQELLGAVSGLGRVILIAGNHDAALGGLLERCGWKAGLYREWHGKDCLFLHGDDDFGARQRIAKARQARMRILMGHEHPAIRIGDGVATSAKCPCFLLGRELVVLPAFSNWAGGTDVRKGEWLSEFVRLTELQTAVAVMGKRLLPVPLRAVS